MRVKWAPRTVVVWDVSYNLQPIFRFKIAERILESRDSSFRDA